MENGDDAFVSLIFRPDRSWRSWRSCLSWWSWRATSWTATRLFSGMTFASSSASQVKTPHLNIKGTPTITPKSKIYIFLLSCSVIYSSRLFWCELPSFGNISRKDLYIFMNIMVLYGVQLAMLKAPKKKNILKTQQQYLFLEIMTRLLNIINRHCCEQFNVGTTFFIP